MDDDTAQPVFRAAKRRKIQRKRTDDDEEPAHSSESREEPTTRPNALEDAKIANGPIGSIAEHEERGMADNSPTEIVRRQKPAKMRKAGIGFANNTNAALQVEALQAEQLPEQLDACGPSAIDRAQSRFVPQMGLMTKETLENCQKHMTSYVDSKLAEMNASALASESHQPQSSRELSKHVPSSKGGYVQKSATEFEALQEVDLGPEATLQNIARTEAARRKLAMGEPFGSDSELINKVKLGRDGKPRKNRNRRSSADIKRDHMVEQLMHDTRLGIFQEPEASNEADDGKATDERVVERFWQEYMEQVNYKNMRKTTANAPGPSGKAAKVDSGQKGPKLGGSRSARAAMKAQEDKAAKKS